MEEKCGFPNFQTQLLGDGLGVKTLGASQRVLFLLYALRDTKFAVNYWVSTASAKTNLDHAATFRGTPQVCEFVRLRIEALRREHPGLYQNVSTLRTNSMLVRGHQAGALCRSYYYCCLYVGAGLSRVALQALSFGGCAWG